MQSHTLLICLRKQMNFVKVVKQMVCSPTPDWELMKAGLNTEHTKMKKEENRNIL